MGIVTVAAKAARHVKRQVPPSSRHRHPRPSTRRTTPRLARLLNTAVTFGTVWLLAVVVSACGEMPVKPAAEESATVEAGYGRAFGRVVYVESGKEREWKWGEELALYVRSVKTGQLQRMSIKGDGRFLWPLQPGDYVIAGYAVVGPPRTGRLWLSFSIPQAGQGVYIGDLRIATSRAHYRFGVEDKYAEALAKVGPQLSAAKIVAVKSLVAHEVTHETVKQVWPICAERSGLTCDKNLQGVEPVQPTGTATSFAAVTSLTPLLTWKPSSKEGMTYDVAVYESLSLAGDVPGAQRIRGARVAYSESLREPRFQISTPLAPNTKYEWSVRLREGENVSTWSTTSYFAFFVVGWASGSGQWFGLTTPAK